MPAVSLHLRKETAGILFFLESKYTVVRVTYDDHRTASMPTTPLPGPQIERIVQVDIRQQWRDDSPLGRSEEHTSELQSRGQLVCRLLLEKKNSHISHTSIST